MRVLVTHGDSLRSTYTDWLTVGGLTDFVGLGPNDPIPHLSGFDCLLITGGGDIEPRRYNDTPFDDTLELELSRDQMEWTVFEHFVKEKKPIAGICRGMQLMNVFFGGTLWQNLSVQLGLVHTGANGTDSYHKILWSDGSIADINSFHRQALKNIPDCFIPLARGEDGTIECITHRTLPISGVQWHPERCPFDRKTWNLLFPAAQRL